MKRFGLLVCLVLVGAVAGVFAASVSGNSVTINDVVAEDLYVAGETVDLQALVDGDLVVAGRNLILGARVDGDVLAAGEIISLSAPVTDDVRTIGRRLEVNDLVGGHLVAAGDVLRLGPDADVSDWVWLRGRNITIEGVIGPGSRLAGRTVSVSGTVNGDLAVYTRQLILTPTAIINGNLTIHTANDPQIDSNARITGEVSVRLDPEHQSDPEWSPEFGLFGALLATVTAVVVYLLFPRFMVSGADWLRGSPLMSLGLGLLTLILTPLIVVLLFATGLGVLLGLALLAVYLLMLLLGTVTGSVFLASLSLRLAGKYESAARTLSAVAVALAVIVVQLIQTIPVAGGLLTMVLFLAGFGAAVATVWRRYWGG